MGSPEVECRLQGWETRHAAQAGLRHSGILNCLLGAKGTHVHHQLTESITIMPTGMPRGSSPEDSRVCQTVTLTIIESALELGIVWLVFEKGLSPIAQAGLEFLFFLPHSSVPGL